MLKNHSLSLGLIASLAVALALGACDAEMDPQDPTGDGGATTDGASPGTPDASGGGSDGGNGTPGDASTGGIADASTGGTPDAYVPSTDAGVGEPPALAGITNMHNVVRAGVGVGPMTWDPALAVIAQTWADGCVNVAAPLSLIDHNANRSATYPGYVGENIFGSSGTATAQGAVNLWAAEVQWYTYATNTCAAGKVCGHYTQIVWANSTKLGCGISNCPSIQYGKSIVCNYAPGGNYSGQSPY